MKCVECHFATDNSCGYCTACITRAVHAAIKACIYCGADVPEAQVTCVCWTCLAKSSEHADLELELGSEPEPKSELETLISGEGD